MADKTEKQEQPGPAAGAAGGAAAPHEPTLTENVTEALKNPLVQTAAIAGSVAALAIPGVLPIAIAGAAIVGAPKLASLYHEKLLPAYMDMWAPVLKPLIRSSQRAANTAQETASSATKDLVEWANSEETATSRASKKKS